MNTLRPLTDQEAKQARRDAEAIWQIRSKYFIFSFVVIFSLAEIVSIFVINLPIFDMIGFIVVLTMASINLWMYHRYWFKKVEDDIQAGKAQQIEGKLIYKRTPKLFDPLTDAAVSVNGKRLFLIPQYSNLFYGDSVKMDFLPRTKLVVNAVKLEKGS